jgi:thiamine-phosphate diphosphorylase
MKHDRRTALDALAAGGVCVVYDPALRADWLDVLTALQAVGVPWFQLRSKQATPQARATWARESRRVLDRSVVIIYDDPDLARTAGADGVHVGAGDPDPAAARGVVGKDAVIGATGSADRWRGLDCTAVDYLGVGPLRVTRTKPDAPTPLGLPGLAAVCAGAARPVVAIGGIERADLAGLRAAGALGVAVQGAVWEAADPAAAAAAMLAAWQCP